MYSLLPLFSGIRQRWDKTVRCNHWTSNVQIHETDPRRFGLLAQLSHRSQRYQRGQCLARLLW